MAKARKTAQEKAIDKEANAIAKKKKDRKDKRLARKAAREAAGGAVKKSKRSRKASAKGYQWEKDAVTLETMAAKFRAVGKLLSEL